MGIGSVAARVTAPAGVGYEAGAAAASAALPAGAGAVPAEARATVASETVDAAVVAAAAPVALLATITRLGSIFAYAVSSRRLACSRVQACVSPPRTTAM